MTFTVKNLSRIFHCIYFGLFILIIAAVCMTYCGNLMNLPLKIAEFDFKGIFIGIFMAAAAVILYGLIKDKINIDKRRINTIYAFAAVVMAILQIFLVFQLKNNPVSDCRFINNAAVAYAKGTDYSPAVMATEKHTTYFSQFPNNWALLILLSNYYKLIYALTGDISVYSAGLLNTAFIQLGIFFLYRCLRLIFTDNRKTALCIILMMGYAPLYTYSSYCYTDSMSLPFVTMAVYLVIKAKRAESTKAFFGFISVVALVMAVGYSIKGSLAVVLIASIIYLAVNLPFRRWGSSAVIMVVFLVLFNSILLHSYAISKGISSEEQLEKYRFPTAHWVMMGLKDEGGFDVNEHNFTKFQPDYETRKAKTVSVIKGRLSDMSAFDMCEHLGKKLGFTWGDGTFYINHHLIKAEKNFTKYIICHGKKSLLYFQSYHFMILIAMTMSIFSGIYKRQKNSISYIRILVFGLTLFLLIWETRSRYLFNFIPLMLIMAADGIDFTAEKIKSAKKQETQTEQVYKGGQT